VVLAFGIALQRLQAGGGDERVAMDAREARAEFVLERAQRVFDQVLAAGVTHRRVFLFGDEAEHVFEPHQFQRVAQARELFDRRWSREEREMRHRGQPT